MSAQSLITKHLDIWMAACNTKSGVGRGNRKKNDFHGIKKLRELILELGVCGKLVPQDITDEPASIILEKIAKIRSERNGSVKSNLSFSTVDDDEWLFEAPSTWQWLRLGEVVNIVRGITFPSSEKSTSPEDGRVACLRTTNVQNTIEWDDLLYIREEFVSREEQFIRFQDVVMSMANSRELVGKVALIDEEPKQKSTFGGFLSVIRPQVILPKFLMLYFRTPKVKKALIGSASQTTNIANISLAKLNPLPFVVPPLPEQHRIVAKVDELMTFCDQLEQTQTDNIAAHTQLVEALLATLTKSSDHNELQNNWQRIAAHFDALFTTENSIDQLKQTILQLAVMGKLVPQNPKDEHASELLKKIEKARDGWLTLNFKENAECSTMMRKLKKLPSAIEPFSLPSSWSCAHLIELSYLLVDCHNKTAPYVADGIPIIRTTNIRNGEFKFDDLKFIDEPTYEFWSRRCPPATGDIMFTREAPMGEAAIVPEGARWCLGQRTMLIRPVHEYISVHYLLLALTEPHLLERASEHAIGSTVKHLRVGDVENLNIPLPPINEQHRIVAKVDELMTLCETIKANLQNAQTTQLALADALVEQAVN